MHHILAAGTSLPCGWLRKCWKNWADPQVELGISGGAGHATSRQNRMHLLSQSGEAADSRQFWSGQPMIQAYDDKCLGFQLTWSQLLLLPGLKLLWHQLKKPIQRKSQPLPSLQKQSEKQMVMLSAESLIWFLVSIVAQSIRINSLSEGRNHWSQGFVNFLKQLMYPLHRTWSNSYVAGNSLNSKEISYISVKAFAGRAQTRNHCARLKKGTPVAALLSDQSFTLSEISKEVARGVRSHYREENVAKDTDDITWLCTLTSHHFVCRRNWLLLLTPHTVASMWINP